MMKAATTTLTTTTTTATTLACVAFGVLCVQCAVSYTKPVRFSSTLLMHHADAFETIFRTFCSAGTSNNTYVYCADIIALLIT